MPQLRSHKQCKLFSHRACPHKDEEIMKRATQDIPEYSGGNYQTLLFPQDEEIDAICSKCEKYTQE